MLLTIALIILVLWLVGVIAHVAGAVINLLLIVGLILLIAHFLNRGRRDNTHV
jgi:hypothetical protein